MSDDNDKKPGKLTLSGKTLSLKANVPQANIGTSGAAAGQVRQSFSGGRTKTVAVEVRRQRGVTPDAARSDEISNLPDAEREKRARVLQEALQNKEKQPKAATTSAAEIGPQAMEPVRSARQKEKEELEKIRAAELEQAKQIEAGRQDAVSKRQEAASKIAGAQFRTHDGPPTEEAESYRDRMKRATERKGTEATERVITLPFPD